MCDWHALAFTVDLRVIFNAYPAFGREKNLGLSALFNRTALAIWRSYRFLRSNSSEFLSFAAAAPHFCVIFCDRQTIDFFFLCLHSFSARFDVRNGHGYCVRWACETRSFFFNWRRLHSRLHPIRIVSTPGHCCRSLCAQNHLHFCCYPLCVWVALKRSGEPRGPAKEEEKKRVGGSKSQVFLRHSLTRAPFFSLSFQPRQLQVCRLRLVDHQSVPQLRIGWKCHSVRLCYYYCCCCCLSSKVHKSGVVCSTPFDVAYNLISRWVPRLIRWIFIERRVKASLSHFVFFLF